MKDWFLIRGKEVYFIIGIKRPKGVQDFISVERWVEGTRKRCRQRWPDSTVFWLGNKKPETDERNKQ